MIDGKYTLQVRYGVEGGQSKGLSKVSVLSEPKMYCSRSCGREVGRSAAGK